MLVDTDPCQNRGRIGDDSAFEEADAGPPPRELTWYEPFKVAADFVLALAMLVCILPLLLLMMALVKLTSRGPVIYSQTRLGRHGRPYKIYKIRTMVHNCEQVSGPQWCVPGDPRITPLGRFLRASHIDEFPQLWNVLRGEMSLVGPRPERPEFVPRLEELVPGYRERLAVRPGLTGLAQIQLPPDTDLASVRRKLARDLYYVERMDFWLDLQILLSTVIFMVGIPYATSRMFLRLPSGEAIERAYRGLLADPKRISRGQPAPMPTS